MQLINGLNFTNIRGDIYGGITAAVVALPLAMAMGISSGVGPIAGIYGAIFVGFFAALLGGTPAQVSGPTGPMTVVMAAVFVQYTSMFPDNPSQGIALAFTVVILGGLFQILFGILKLGKYIELVPHPVVSGFMSGIGIIIILLQFGPVLGQESIAKPLEAAQNIPQFLAGWDKDSTLLGILTLAIVYGIPMFLPKINRLLPSPLIALVLGTLAYLLFMPESKTPIIGNIPTGFPEFRMPIIDPSLMLQMIASSLTLAGLGAIDSLLTSLVADNVTRIQHKSNRELIGQGIGNMIAGFFGGLPGAGATMRTVVNVKAGGRTPISGALHAVILLAIVLGAGSLASDIPKAVLAGILIKVGTDIIDWDYLKRLTIAPKAGVLIMFVVLVLTVTVDLLLAVGVGMVMASFLFMKRMTDMQVKGMKTSNRSGGDISLSDVETNIMDKMEGRILLFHPTGPLSFSSAKAMVRLHSNIGMEGHEIVLLDMAEVPNVDFTASRAIEDIIVEVQDSGRNIFLSGACENVMRFLVKQKIIHRFQKDEIHSTRLAALQHAQNLLTAS